MDVDTCKNCGAARQVGQACPFCKAAYGLVTPTARITELGKSTDWVEAPADIDAEIIELVAMEIDEAIDAGHHDAAVKAHQEAWGCDPATSKRIVEARIATRREAWKR